MSALSHSPIESANLGFSIFRGKVNFTMADLFSRQPLADIVIVRDTEIKVQSLYREMRRHADIQVQDTILSFRKFFRDEARISPTGLVCSLRPVNDSDWPFITRLMQQTFAGYPGHYQRNLFFEEDRAVQGQIDWLRRLSLQTHPSVFIIEFGAEPSGVLGYTLTSREVQLSLAAIDPKVGFRRRNLLLVEAVRVAEEEFIRQGYLSFTAQTQVSNLSIQRDLIRYVHCEPAHGVVTLHCHYFLNRLVMRGKELAVGESFPETAAHFLRINYGEKTITRTTHYINQNESITRALVVEVPMTGSSDIALFFCGMNKHGDIRAHASAYLI